jgi:SAM-dependent methyltransferase
MCVAIALYVLDPQRSVKAATAVAEQRRPSENAAMGFYSHWLLPRILDLTMGMPFVTEERRKVLAGVAGDVLEVGFGSGLNLPHYPTAVRRLVAVDPATQSAKLARQRIAAAPFPVEYLPFAGEQLDAPSASFDAVVSTFTLCTIPGPSAALAQMKRVLQAGRSFVLCGTRPRSGSRRTALAGSSQWRAALRLRRLQLESRHRADRARGWLRVR